jgi:hypothetical protein
LWSDILPNTTYTSRLHFINDLKNIQKGKDLNSDAKFEVFTAAKIQVGILWVVVLDSAVVGYQSLLREV